MLEGVLDPEAHLAEPVRFELLRSARPEETRQLEAHAGGLYGSRFFPHSELAANRLVSQ